MWVRTEMGRGRKSVADHILERFKDEAMGPKSCYLVMYDFELGEGKVISPRFFRNLKRITSRLGDGEREQYSVIKCTYLKTTQVLKALAEHYGCSQIKIYRVVEVKS